MGDKTGIIIEEKRRKLCEESCAAVDCLIERELHANVEQLNDMVDNICGMSQPNVSLLGVRLAGALMQSYMGATVDRQVYHPLLRASLREPGHWPLSVVVPLTWGNCDSTKAALTQIGKELWAAVHPAAGKPPKIINSTDLMCTLAREWSARDAPECVPGILVLLEDFAKFDRQFVRNLLQTLAEAQHRQGARRVLSFGVVLWASNETTFDLQTFDHLALSRYEFIPPSMMLNNVLFALLVQPTLPFSIPAEVYMWIIKQFENLSHNLTWLSHILRSLVRLYFFRGQENVWLLDCSNDVPATMQRTIAKLFCKPVGPDAEIALICASELSKLHVRRVVCGKSFVVVWRLLRVCLGDKCKPIMEAFGDFLKKTELENDDSRKLYSLHVTRLLTDQFQLQDQVTIAKAHSLMCQEMDEVLNEFQSFPFQMLEAVSSEYSPLLLDALRVLKHLGDDDGGADAPVQDHSHPTTTATITTTTAPATSSSSNPKAALLFHKSSSAVQRSGNSGTRRAKGVVLQQSSNKPNPLVDAMTGCFDILISRGLCAYSNTFLPLRELTQLRVSLHELTSGLIGDFFPSVSKELNNHSALQCKCCKPLSSEGSGRIISRKRSNQNKWSHVYSGDLSDLASREDVSVAAAYLCHDRLDPQDWYQFFEDVFSGSPRDHDLVSRFQVAVATLKVLGLIVPTKGNQMYKKTRE